MIHDPFCKALMTSHSALFLDGWLKFNEEKWGYKAERVLFQPTGKELPKLEGVFYLDRRGHVVMPPRNPYLPLQFTPTPTEQPYRLYTQWLEVSELLAEDLEKRGFRGTVSFPPGFTDGRSFQWKSFSTNVRYTFATPLPVEPTNQDPSVHKNINKAIRLGYRVQQTNDWEAIHFCLQKTEDAKDFSHMTTAKDLARLSELLGGDHCLGYICRDTAGNPVSGQIKIFLSDGISIDWSAGTDREHIKNGVNQLTYEESFKDMTARRGHLFDLCGANIKPVANAKAAWGFPLVPYLTITYETAPRKLFRFFVPKTIRPALRQILRGV